MKLDHAKANCSQDISPGKQYTVYGLPQLPVPYD